MRKTDILLLLCVAAVLSTRAQGVQINELMASNRETLQDSAGDYEDWVELYNPASAPVDVGGWFLSDDFGEPQKWQIPRDSASLTTIAGGGFLLIWADNQPEQGVLHARFRLSAGGEALILSDPEGHVIDRITYGAQERDRSVGRPGQSPTRWQPLERPTPGRANSGEPGVIVINEIMYNPASVDGREPQELEFIELFNVGGSATDLSGWRLTGGIEFEIPDGTTLAPAAFLVIAADLSAFTQAYPSTEVLGDWTGRLSNGGETLRLIDAQGRLIDKVSYADQGAWADRILGPSDNRHRGWRWVTTHDGGGPSLELMCPLQSNEVGQNWSASLPTGGTPGLENSRVSSDRVPLVTEVMHAPALPDPDDNVTVTATILDVGSDEVTLRYRADRSRYLSETVYPRSEPEGFERIVMHRPGASDDLFTAIVPAHPDGTVVEFYVEIGDRREASRTWPAPCWINGVPQQVGNALYLVDGAFDPETIRRPGAQPLYHIVLTQMEKDRLLDIGDGEGNENNSNAQMNATFISTDGTSTRVHYNTSVRIRGHGSRNRRPNNYRINFPHDRLWKGRSAVNLNTRETLLQVVGSVIFAEAGLSAAAAKLVQVRLNGDNLADPGPQMYGAYAQLEVINGDFVDRQFPDDSAGNVYKCMRMVQPGATLAYQGPEADAYRINYFKQTNASRDEWSDLIDLTFVLSQTPDDLYVDEVKRVMQVDPWLRVFAVSTLLVNAETSLANGNGDDYFMYRGQEDTRFMLIPHDLDSIFGHGSGGGSEQSSLFRATGVSTMARLLRQPEFVSAYYGHLAQLIDTVFAPGRLRTLLVNTLGSQVPTAAIDAIVGYARRRNAYVLSQLPARFSVESELPQVFGLLYTPEPDFVLEGTVPFEAQSVLVNGQAAALDARRGRWQSDGAGAAMDVMLIGRGSIWRYNDLYDDLGPDWAKHIDDQEWAAGPGVLGYGTVSAGGPLNTLIGYIDTDPTTPTEEHNMTTYFSHSFEVSDPELVSSLDLLIRRDAGAVIYLNGEEIARSNMPAGPVTYETPAARQIRGSAKTTYHGAGAGGEDFRFLDSALLQPGLNRLAVEVHLFPSLRADEMSFDLELVGHFKLPDREDLNPGINRIQIEAFSEAAGLGSRLAQAGVDLWYDDGGQSNIGGRLTQDTRLDVGSGPWQVQTPLILPAGVTLTIEPGTTLFFEPDTGITVQAGGTLVAEGTPFQHIRLTSTPAREPSRWAGLVFDGSQEDNILTYVDCEYGDGQGVAVQIQDAQVDFDHVTWSHAQSSVFQVNNSRVTVIDSHLPPLAGRDLVVGRGLRANQRLLFERCTFGFVSGDRDVVDFSDCQRPGPILQFYDCHFLGSTARGIDLHGADAHIEGCTFQGFTGKAGSRVAAAALAMDDEQGRTSQVTLTRTLFVGNDRAVSIKARSRLTAQHNTIVDSAVAAISFGDASASLPTPDQRVTLESVILWNNATSFELYFQDPLPAYGPAELSIHRSLLPTAWHGLGVENLDLDPKFQPDDFTLSPYSPARALSAGHTIPPGATIRGEPSAVTHHDSATLFIAGPGITHYRYRLNDPLAPWEGDRPIEIPLLLNDLPDGQSHAVQVLGRDSAGRWQTDPTLSESWLVKQDHRRLRISEVMVNGDPPWIELHYDGPSPWDPSGTEIWDEPNDPTPLIIDTAGPLSPGAFYILDDGLTVSAQGGNLMLVDTQGGLLDSVTYGAQIPRFSIGWEQRSRAWSLCHPTPGRSNEIAFLSDPRRVRFNEWLAVANQSFESDFVELMNPTDLPLDIGGFYLTDAPVTRQALSQLPPLTFIGVLDVLVLQADGKKEPGHVDFKLSSDGEMIGLFTGDLEKVDMVQFGDQTPDVSQGRSQEAPDLYRYFENPSPGVVTPN